MILTCGAQDKKQSALLGTAALLLSATSKRVQAAENSRVLAVIAASNRCVSVLCDCFTAPPVPSLYAEL